jgi:outer membrane protein assembly factor BamB
MAARVGFVMLSLLVLPAPSMLLKPASKKQEPGEYFWPEARGRFGSYSVSPYVGPRDLSTTLAWTWSNHGPSNDLSKYSTAAHSGLVMDDERSIYLSSTDGIRKFSSDGQLLWHAKMPTWRIPALYQGACYVSSSEGTMYALSMRTGEVLWSRNFTDHLDTDISGVGVRHGVIVTESEGIQGGGAAAVCGLNATTGEELWKFQTEGILWNFMPMFTDNDTFVFQDRAGGSYHHRLSDGARIWKAGYAPKQDDFTDGMTMLADGVVYTTHSDGTCCQADQSATLRAYDLSSGRQLWNQDFGHVTLQTCPCMAASTSRTSHGAGSRSRRTRPEAWSRPPRRQGRAGASRTCTSLSGWRRAS